MNVLPTNSTKLIVKCFINYLGYFGSRYVGNDIQLMCGNLLDHPIAKTITLAAIMYQATDNVDLTVMMTMFFLLAQYFMSSSDYCRHYVDKTQKNTKELVNGGSAWVMDKTLTSLNIEKKK